MIGRFALGAACLIGVSLGQSVPPQEEVFRVGEDVKLPKLVRKREPKYTEQARSAGVQGQVLLEIKVDKAGIPLDPVILSPLGYGLEEAAIDAIMTWRFEPATKEGQPVTVLVTIQVDFRLMGRYFDRKAEQRRTRFNEALHQLQDPDRTKHKKPFETLEALVKDKFAPAQYVYGMYLREGIELPQDEAHGMELVERAAKAKYGPAMFVLAQRRLRADPQGPEAEGTRDAIRNAAILGSTEAQYFIASSYELGTNGYRQDTNSAIQFYRLCAAANAGTCQFRIGRLLLDRPGRSETDYLQALAWLELATGNRVAGAAELTAAEPPLTSNQADWVKRLRSQLVHQ